MMVVVMKEEMETQILQVEEEMMGLQRMYQVVVLGRVMMLLELLIRDRYEDDVIATEEYEMVLQGAAWTCDDH
jgi:hypothetical protein